MPLYLYRCFLCEEEHEIVKTFKEFDRDEVCPRCNGNMERQIAKGTTFTLKGGGWAADGYSSKK